MVCLHVYVLDLLAMTVNPVLWKWLLNIIYRPNIKVDLQITYHKAYPLHVAGL